MMSGATETAATTNEEPATDQVLAVTAEALERILEIRDAEEDPGTLCLRVEITGTSGAEYAYDLAFSEISSLDEQDDVSVQGGLSVVVDAASVDRLRGSTLDLPRNGGQSGLVIRNPNRPNPLAGRDIVLTGDTADQVNQLLAEIINPGLASHGGFAALVGVDDSTVFVTMGGGCQGCAMSAATLREGITASIIEAIPEVTAVVDVTDHDAGDNPFYT
jgi:Fe/S biogenesis protein NfuA